MKIMTIIIYHKMKAGIIIKYIMNMAITISEHENNENEDNKQCGRYRQWNRKHMKGR